MVGKTKNKKNTQYVDESIYDMNNWLPEKKNELFRVTKGTPFDALEIIYHTWLPMIIVAFAISINTPMWYLAMAFVCMLVSVVRIRTKGE